MVENTVIRKEVSKLLDGADLNSLTVKKVRKELEERLGVSLAEQKAEIEQAIESVLAARSAGNKADSDEEAEDDDTDSSLSDLEDARPAKKSAPAAKRASQSKSSADKVDQPMTDEELARQLHLKENGLTTRQRRSATRDASSGSAAKSKRAPRKSGGGGGGFSKPCALSPALAEVVGCDSMPRQQVVKRLWDIAKERDMFDPKNKQFVICDAEFERLFGKKRLRMFALMKYLKNHVKNVD